MALLNTKAIVLSSIKYGETSLIVKCYTQEEGVKSYLIRGVLKPKKKGIKAAHFQPYAIKNYCESQHKKHFKYYKRSTCNSPL